MSKTTQRNGGNGWENAGADADPTMPSGPHGDCPGEETSTPKVQVQVTAAEPQVVQPKEDEKPGWKFREWL